MFSSSSQDLVAASGQRRPAKPSGAVYVIQSTTTCSTIRLIETLGITVNQCLLDGWRSKQVMASIKSVLYLCYWSGRWRVADDDGEELSMIFTDALWCDKTEKTNKKNNTRRSHNWRNLVVSLFQKSMVLFSWKSCMNISAKYCQMCICVSIRSNAQPETSNFCNQQFNTVKNKSTVVEIDRRPVYCIFDWTNGDWKVR